MDEKQTLKAGTVVTIDGASFKIASDVEFSFVKKNRKLSEIVFIDDDLEILTINGNKFSGEVIRGLGFLDVGKSLVIIERRDDVITVIK